MAQPWSLDRNCTAWMTKAPWADLAVPCILSLVLTLCLFSTVSSKCSAVLGCYCFQIRITFKGVHCSPDLNLGKGDFPTSCREETAEPKSHRKSQEEVGHQRKNDHWNSQRSPEHIFGKALFSAPQWYGLVCSFWQRNKGGLSLTEEMVLVEELHLPAQLSLITQCKPPASRWGDRGHLWTRQERRQKQFNKEQGELSKRVNIKESTQGRWVGFHKTLHVVYIVRLFHPPGFP